MNERQDALARLAAELDPSKVATVAVGGGRSAPYLEGWYVISAANGIFGFDGWSYELREVEPRGSWVIQRRGVDVTVTLYQARVTVTAMGVIRTDVGTGIAENETADAHSTAVKGAATDALKRALRTFGAQFGNELYDKAPQARREPPGRDSGASGQSVALPTTRAELEAWAREQHGLTKPQLVDALGIPPARFATLRDDEVERAYRKVLEVVTR